MKELIGTGKELTRRAVLEEMKKGILSSWEDKQAWACFDFWAQKAGFQADALILVNEGGNLYNNFISLGNEWFRDWLIKHGFAVEKRVYLPVKISQITDSACFIMVGNKHEIAIPICILDQRMDIAENGRTDKRKYCIERENY